MGKIVEIRGIEIVGRASHCLEVLLDFDGLCAEAPGPAFYPERGEVTRGVATAHAAPPVVEQIAGDDLPPVWPDPEGGVRGETLKPLHPSVPRVARGDRQLYELLALVDVMRIGRARERKLAEQHLKRRLAP